MFFDYGVAVFYGFEEGEERKILEDLEKAGVFVRRVGEEDWEVEECHYVVRTFPSCSRNRSLMES